MARTSVQFVCNSCGSVQSRWMGKCPDCGVWDALEEFKVTAGSKEDAPLGMSLSPENLPQARPISDLNANTSPAIRLPSGIGELDRVLGGMTPAPGSMSTENASPQKTSGGGLVVGSAVLVGGNPGIGKSTLMLQAAGAWAASGQRVLYVTSEESVEQLRLRAQRLGVMDEESDDLFVLADTNIARIIEQIRRVNPAVVVIDSIQMVYKGDLPAAPGSVAQLRACSQQLVYLAKTSNVAILLVGHVTKQGQIAGPRLLEHMVDTVLYFEGDRYHNHRIIRAVKNRFGTTLEVGLFDMTDRGLREVADGAGLLAAEYQTHAGSVVCPVIQGTRCLLIELQALTSTGFLGSAKRKNSGLDSNRLAMLIAVLEKRGGLRLADQDVFASSIGGMKIAEPGADLALAMAIASAHHDRQLDTGVCCVGEIGLGGEVRHVQQMPQRIIEAARLGFTRILTAPVSLKAPPGTTIIPVKTISQAIEHLN